ncbi:MAG: hypothetical protein IPJ77_01890 [Planctomycetes bacterium]|nr:hypothetical protein [Planctomycetota bacterium]
MSASSAFLVVLLALAPACSTTRERAPERRPPAREVRAVEPAAPAPLPAAGAPAWQGAREVRSHAGRFLVRWTSSLDPILEGETFSVDAWVFDARGAEPVLATDVALDVDAGMPQHGHGMAALARVSRRADGGWHAEGLRFHMMGAWELTFDVTRGALTERAQAWVELE